MKFNNWKPWALMLLSAGGALILAGHGKLGVLIALPAGIMFGIANSLNGGKYFD